MNCLQCAERHYLCSKCWQQYDRVRLCLACYGDGCVWTFDLRADRTEWRRCPTCKGEGVVPAEDEREGESG